MLISRHLGWPDGRDREPSESWVILKQSRPEPTTTRIPPLAEPRHHLHRGTSVPRQCYSMAAEKPSARSCWLKAAVSGPVTRLNLARASASFAASSLFTEIC